MTKLRNVRLGLDSTRLYRLWGPQRVREVLSGIIADWNI